MTWAPEAGDVVTGPIHEYELLEHVDTGGFTAVYRARVSDTGERVCVKYPNFASPNPHVDDFVEREVRALRTIDRLGGHPTVMSLREHFVADGTAFLVVEFVEGAAMERTTEPVGPERARSIGLALCGALAMLHENDLVYRDVKADNVMLTPAAVPVLVDLNAVRTLPACGNCGRYVRHADANETECADCGDSLGPVTRIGTAHRGHFRAPEQADAARPPGPWTDVYGVGKLLFLLLTGFTRLGSDVDPRDHAGCPDDLAGVIERATATDPAERYASAAALGRALHRRTVDPGPPTVGLTDVESGRTYELTAGDAIGRAGTGATVPIDDPGGVISRPHATVEYEDGRWWVIDRSLNGCVLRRGGDWHRFFGSRARDAHDRPDASGRRALSTGDVIAPIDPAYERRFRVDGPPWTNL